MQVQFSMEAMFMIYDVYGLNKIILHLKTLIDIHPNEFRVGLFTHSIPATWDYVISLI